MLIWALVLRSTQLVGTCFLVQTVSFNSAVQPSRLLSLCMNSELVFICSVIQFGGGGFFLACKDFVGCLTIHLMRALFFKVEVSSHTLIALFRPGSVYSG